MVLVASAVDACPSAEELAAFFGGGASAEALSDLDLHLDRCADCRRLAAAVAQVETVSRAVHEPALSADEAPGGSERYQLQELLGAGGMGLVFAATDAALGRRVAVKMLRSGAPGEAAGRLLREARAMAQVAHDGVVEIHDVLVSGEQVLIVMELVEGVSLRVWLAKARPWRERLAPLLLAGEALAVAHGRGLVHRDFKPDNVLVGADGRPKVTDFGLASGRGVDRDGGGKRVIGGTLPYMAPEQHLGGEVDARADQFAFCVTAYEALYGVRPFAGASGREILDQVRGGALVTPPAARSSRAGPVALRRVLLRGLAYRPDDRYASMAELLAALRRAARPVPVLAVAFPAAGIVALAVWIVASSLRSTPAAKADAAAAPSEPVATEAATATVNATTGEETASAGAPSAMASPSVADASTPPSPEAVGRGPTARTSREPPPKGAPPASTTPPAATARASAVGPPEPESAVDAACSTECEQNGLCTARAGVCVATSDALCEQSMACTFAAGCKKRGDLCGPGSDDDCKQSTPCLAGGWCSFVGGRCRPKTSADCALGSNCADFGFCSLVGGKCTLETSADCARSNGCKAHGWCTLVAGKCVASGS